MSNALPIRPCDAPQAPRRADFVSSPRARHSAPAAPHSPPAFSLLELVFVIAIIAVITAIAVPRFGGAVNNYCLDAAAKRLVADLALAQSQARTASSPQTVTFTLPSSSYTLVGMKSINSNAANSFIVKLTDRPYESTIVSASFASTTSVTFDIYGIPDNGGAVVIQRGSAQKTVTLDAATGKATSS